MFRFLLGSPFKQRNNDAPGWDSWIQDRRKLSLSDAADGRSQFWVGRWLRAGGLQWRQPRTRAMGGLVLLQLRETIPGSALKFSLLQFSHLSHRDVAPPA